MSVCLSKTRIILVTIRGCHWNGWKEAEYGLPCGRNWWTMWILKNQHHFLTTYILDVLTVNAQRMKLILRNLQGCLNHVFLQEQLVKSLTQRRWHGPMIWKDMLENALSDIASWQTRKCSSKIKFQVFAWMIINSNRKNLNQLVNYHTFAHKLYWNACIWHEIGRPDILWSVNKLARAVTQWTQDHTSDFRQYCHVGNNAQNCRLFFFKTQTLLETLRTQHLLLVSHVYIFGSRTFVSISWMCKKQTSYSHSSTESYIIAGLRTDGLLALDLRDIVIKVLRSSKNTPRHEKPTQGNLVLDGKSNSSTEMRKREFEHLSNVDYVPTNTHSSQGESQLHIFKDNEAVIKMIMKGRSPTRRHVSRTDRVALDWLFDRIRHANQRIFFSWRLESSSSFVQLHEFLDVLLQPFWQFLSDPIRKQSAMSKRGQVATSGEGSPMAKPKPTVPANARPINSVLVSPWSARENPSQYLGCPVNPRTDVEGQGDLTRTRKYVQTIQNP